MSKIERRFLNIPGVGAEIVERGAGMAPCIRGYAAVFHREGDPGTEFRMMDDVAERIAPGAFDRTLKSADVRGAFNHDPSMILGRSSAGTLRLGTDARGLWYEIDPPDTTAGRDAMALIKRGDVSGSSFAFVPTSTTYSRADDGTVIITRNDLDLIDVGPVTFPAYEGTSTGIRAVGASFDDEIERARAETLPKMDARSEAYKALARAIGIETDLAGDR
jgi:hypothetical protein